MWKDQNLVREYSPGLVNNFNNNFRDFIIHVNSLHNSGSVDCILATGDLIDYIYDSGNPTAKTPSDPSQVDRINQNNFDFLKRLILGLEPGRDGTKNEELLVPVFTTLGNHDYRDMPYCWIGEIDITGFRNPVIPNYDIINLDYNEAKGLEGGEKPLFSTDNAKKMAHVETDLTQYDREFNNQRSFIINLGPHRIVILDSKHDIGIIEDNWDAFLHYMGWDSEDSKRFAEANPNSLGIQQEHIDLIKQALAEAGSTGVVIVGIHAPLLDMENYPHYLRETEHDIADQNEVRRGFPSFSHFQPPGYQPPGSDNWPEIGTSYFKFGVIEEPLTRGVSKGLNQAFLEMCAGVNSPRKVDLVISGHGHRNVEFRVGYEPGKKLLFYHDYYTENPTRYYPMRLLSTSDFRNWKQEVDKTQELHKQYIQAMEYYSIVPKDGVSSPVFKYDHRPDALFPRIIEVPPYPTPLNKASDKIGWWTEHRPLFIQTAPLGPVETLNSGTVLTSKRLSDYALFQGCKLITIENNVISSIETVKMSEIQGPRPRLCSLKELVKVRGISFPASIRSLAEDISLIPPISQRLKKL